MIDVERRSLLPWCAIVLGLAVLVVFIPHWVSPGYYFDDDVRHYFMVSIHEIGTRLLSGEWPIMTLRSAYSGNLIGEGQFGLFNPLTMALYVIVSGIDDLDTGALIYAGFHLLMTALGVFLVACRLRLSHPYAALVAIAFTASNFNSYWYASSWWNALTCNAWVVWASLAWLAVLENRRWLVAAILATAAVLTSGWPHGAVALAVILGVFAARQLRVSDTVAVAVPVIGGGLAAILLSLPALVPLMTHVAESSRSVVSFSHAGTMVATFDSLASLSWPSYTSALPLFFGHNTSQPDFYCAWFVLPLFLIHRKSIVARWQADDGTFKALAILACLFGILSLGPQQIGPLRWPIRFVSYFHLFALLCVGRLASSDSGAKTSTAAMAALWVLGFVLSWQQSPNEVWLHATFAGLGFFGSYLAMVAASDRTRGARLLAMTILVFCVSHFCWTNNSNVGHWQTPTVGHLDSTSKNPMANVMVMQQQVADVSDEWRLFPSGNVGLWEDRLFVNGYSPVEFAGLHQYFCLNAWSWVCADAVGRLLTVDRTTGQDWAALMRVSELRVKHGSLTKSMRELGPQRGFRRAAVVHLGEVWQRDVATLPGSMSWASPEIAVGSNATYSPQSESVVVSNASASPGLIVWARTAFQGYEATLNGVPLDISPYGSILVSVQVPPGAKGPLALSYRPVGWHWTTPLALLGVVLALVVLGLCRRVAFVQ